MKKKLLSVIIIIISLQVNAQCWQSVKAGEVHTIAKKNDGTLWSWGWNIDGELGDGTNTDQNTPLPISTNNIWQFISVGTGHTQVIKSDGTLWAWGYNASGELGDGTNVNKNIPTQIGVDNNWEFISAGIYKTLGIKNNGTIWAWGSNIGDFGNGTSSYTVGTYNIPTQIGTGMNWQSCSAGRDFSVAIKTNGTLWSCGQNFKGQLGNGNDSNILPNNFFWNQIGGSNSWQTISTGNHFTIALKSDGTLWAWGDNQYGQLGNSTNIISYVPIQIGTDNNWQSISTGYGNTLALKNDGTLWAWGRNYHGQLGIGSTQDKNFPTQIGTDNDWQSISIYSGHSMAVKTNGSLWSWGWNEYGQLGDGSNTNKLIPTLINCPSLSVEEAIQNSNPIKIYPNPTRNLLYLQSTNLLIDKITITDLTGKKVLEKMGNINQVNIELLQSGIYLLIVESEGKKYTNKFIKI